MNDAFTPDLWPTPLALIHRRIELCPSRDHQERFTSALLLAEATIKLSTAAALAILGMHKEDKSLRYQYQLIRSDSIGSWTGELRRIAQELHRVPDIDTKKLARLFTQKVRIESDSQSRSFCQAHRSSNAIIQNLYESTYEGLNRSRISLLDLIEDCVYIRNRTRGHGAPPWVFYSNQCDNMANLACTIASAISPWIDLCIVDEPASQEGDAYTLFSLFGLHPGRLEIPATQIAADRGQLLLLTGAAAAHFPPLVDVHPATHESLFANGNWSDATSQAQFINYVDGRTERLHRPSLGIAPSRPSPSHTSPLQELSSTDTTLHNLPTQIPTYVSRPSLERHLKVLLTDRMHRIISIRGPGGAGKTTLALRIAHELANTESDPAFDAIIWFSGRDVDLLPSGPQPVRQDVSDIESIARSFASLFDRSEEHLSAIESLQEELDPDRSTVRYLFILDNVETLESPSFVHQFFDRHVILPSKLLTTTRHQSFVGDFPINLPGMDDSEAHSLIRVEARRRHAEARFDDHTCERIVIRTGGLPYALTLATAHVASGLDVNSLPQTLASDEILAALFDRSVEALDEDGMYLYLLLGRIGKPIVTHALNAVLRVNGRNFQSAMEQLDFYSLSKVDDDYMSLIQMAYAHSDRLATGYEDEIMINHLAERLRRWSAPRPSMSPVSSFFRNLLDDLHSLPLSERRAVIEIAEQASQDDGDLGLAIAQEKWSLSYKASDVRAAFKHAAQASPNNAEIWVMWSQFEQQIGSEYESIVTSIRAIEAGYSDPRFSSEISSNLTAFLTDHKDRIPVRRRGSFISAVRHDLERHRKNRVLTATELSRLAWLYLIEASSDVHDHELISRAEAIAQEGLMLEPDNIHCQRILD